MAGGLPIHVHAGAAVPPPDAVGRGTAGPPPAWIWVGDTAIDEAEIAREMQHHRSDDPHRSRADAARALVVRELLRREVDRLALAADVRPEAGESAEEAAIRVLLDREAPVPEVDAAACRRYFEQNRARLHQPDRVHAHHILLAAPPADASARGAARVRAEALIRELREDPARFGELAREHSACPSREQGGELGWIERGETPPEFERQLFMLPAGLAGMSVESRWGHHVVQVDAIERGAPLDYAEALPKIAAYLESQARQNAIHQYLQILAERHGVRGLESAAER